MLTSDLIASIALVVSLASVWFTFRSAQVAYRSYRLVEKQATRLNAGLSLELLSYEAAKTSDESQRLFAFRLAVTNNSDAATSLKTIELALLCSRPRGPVTHYRLFSDPDIQYRGVHPGARLHLPAPIASRSTVSGTAVFRLPTELLKTSRIESYTIKVSDSAGAASEREALFVNERSD